MPPLRSTPGVKPSGSDVRPAPVEALDRAELKEGADSSPAVALQMLIADDIESGRASEGRTGRADWAPRTTIWFSVGVGLLLWAALALVVYFLS